MKSWRFLMFLVVAAVVGARAEVADEIAKEFGLVGTVVGTSVLEWNTNPDRSKSGRIYPIDPQKIRGGVLLVGLSPDNDPSTPYFGEIFVRRLLVGYDRLFIRVHKVSDGNFRAMDDMGNEFVIRIYRRG